MISGLAAVAGSILAQKAAAKIEPTNWKRTNFAGNRTSLVGGLDAFAGLLAGSMFAGEERNAAIVATVSGAIAGYVDDHLEDSFPTAAKGFKGHLGEFRQGRVSSGLAKIATIGAGSLIAAGIQASYKDREVYETIMDAVTISLSANLINLLDLRPGRARKAIMIVAGVPAAWGSQLARASAGAAFAGIGPDLHGRTMLGDLGANALGAHLGVVLTEYPKKAKIPILAVLIALNVVSEKVSFSRIIEQTPWLRSIDSLGRPA
ncbi:UDP-N-acetylmuramyl pentapeptide phosphotransferase/UDP-N-acetylglucosamine-1-phosphate transferase [Trueperella bonasi]|uniref:UDP-N-acetylmuramyl pentapeptide phosphotransferase/UDP-N-acetylglucosamine-1-phosphate transferase n=1 Tax=Trueperella bonasi TaxID=312286 RepID=A0ABT9NDU1_9ACTO|nr:hypothetical protein [Trueperella bonasi]MDP9805564.1 UDP-N-acetylmuramyl pentapeptide phosphotransferase/UDP-N-acetylglucosamine-1-phosphate transferase [Trueperella bonasi]